MKYQEDTEDVKGFGDKSAAIYDELREPTDGEGSTIYAITPFMLLEHLLHVLPPSLGEVARKFRKLQLGTDILDDIYRREHSS